MIRELCYSSATHQRFAQEPWDAIVIGSGLGGLTTAALLTKAGKKVLILERHYVPGGFTHTFTRNEFEWDVGVHYVGQVGDPDAVLRKVFDYVTDGNLTWAPMGHVYDRVIIDGDVYDFVCGVENQILRMIGRFPAEERAIRRYYNLVQSVGASSAWFFGEKTMPGWLSKTLGPFLRWRFQRWAGRTTFEVLHSLTNNQRLISVLCAQCGDYGLTPKKSSFGIHAIVVEHYLNGGSYPSGGAGRIHDTILEGVKKNGGRLLLKADVDRILVDAGTVTGVRMKDGERFSAPVVISNAGVWNTFKRLLPPGIDLPFDMEADLRRVGPSTAHFCLYVGLNGSDEELKLPKHNFWVYDRYDFDEAYERSLREPEATPPLIYISFPSAKDPEWPKEHPGRATIQVIAACPFDFVKEWRDKPWRRRGEAYLAMKQRFTERLFEKLYQTLPQLRGRVEYSELSTPLSTCHFMNYQHGEIYGLEHTPERFRLRWLRPRTPVKGLYLTGQDLVTVGVGGALFSGVLAATSVLRKPVLWQILKSRRKQPGPIG